MDSQSTHSACSAGSHEVSSTPLIDIERENGPLREEIQAAMREVCDSGKFVLGPECSKLEERLAAYCGVRHAVGCASGSDALLLALMACGIGPGDEVIVPSYTFFATVSAVSRLGATPVFVDIEPAHFNIDPQRVPEVVTPRTKAIIPVHLFGQCADMETISQIASRHGLRVIEDACQAIGATFGAKRAGAMGDVGCFSFYPTKNLGAFGDGGMMTTNDDALAEKLRLLRAHGMQPRYFHRLVGVNSRLDSLQAAVLNVKLNHLDRWTELRRTNSARYDLLFAGCGVERKLGLPCAAPNRGHVWNQYVIRVPGGRRDALRAYLAQRQIGSEIYYPVPVHLQECFADLRDQRGRLPETERAALETLALPIFPHLTAAEQDYVVSHIAAFLAIGSGQAENGAPKPKYLEATKHAAGRDVK